jgi:hypothetical protein
MNDRSLVPTPFVLSALRPSEPPPPATEEDLPRDESDEIDKYDISTLACTD